MSGKGVLKEYRAGHKLSSKKSGKYCYYCCIFLREEEKMVCEKRSMKGRVSSESPDEEFVLKTKASSNCEQNSVGLSWSLVVFRNNSLLSFLEEVLLEVFL